MTATTGVITACALITGALGLYAWSPLELVGGLFLALAALGSFAADLELRQDVAAVRTATTRGEDWD